jgi:hypothetical protein
MEIKPTKEQIENMELLKSIKDVIETQTGSLSAELTANQAKTDANKEADLEERRAERKDDREEMLAAMDANVKANQEEVKAHMASFVFRIDAQRERMMAWPRRTEANPEEMQSEAERRVIPKEHATVKPVGGLRKRRSCRNQAAGRHHKQKDGSRRKLVTTRRGTTLHAKVT